MLSQGQSLRYELQTIPRQRMLLFNKQPANQRPEKETSTSTFNFTPTCIDLENIMTSIADGLFKSLPKPKYTGEEEELPQHAQPRGPRVVGADQLDETQVVLRVSAGPGCYD